MGNETSNPEALAAASLFNAAVDSLMGRQSGGPQFEKLVAGINLSGLGITYTGDNEKVAVSNVSVVTTAPARSMG